MFRQKFIHNKTEDDKTYSGLFVPALSSIELQPELWREIGFNQGVANDILSEIICASVDGVEELPKKTSLALLQGRWESSTAIDKDGENQSLSGDGWHEFTASRKIWDLNSDYDIESNNFKAPFNGVFFFDGQFRVSNFANVDYVEIALFKRGEPDDYWFIIDRKYVDGKPELAMSGSTYFDFYEDEEFCLKIRLNKVLPLVGCSASISGDDDFTAWGYSFGHQLR